MQQYRERDLRKTALELCGESLRRRKSGARPSGQSPMLNQKQNQSRKNTNGLDKESLAPLVETRLIGATWALRRMPDRERGFLRMRGSLWPDMQAEPGQYPAADVSSMASRRSARLSPKEIDQMQPALDLLTLLPDIFDRQLLFWAAWHQDGQKQDRIPWAKVRRSLGATVSRWTLKRRYDAGLLWLGALVALQR